MRRRFYILPILVLLLALPAAWFAHAAWFAEPSAAERFVIAEITRADIEDAVTATGTLQPRDYVDVGTQVSGQLKVVDVVIGQQVKQGDLLAQIDPVVLQARVDAGRAQIQNQTAQLTDKRAQVVLAEQQLQRQRNLMKEDATTTEALQTAEALLLSLKAQISAIQAQMRQTESTLRGDQANLGYTKIYAPMSGTVVSQTAKQGQTLNANQQAPIILRIADLSTMTVQTQVSEADVSKLRLGMSAYFTTLGSQNKRWHGQLRQVNPTPTVSNNVVLYDSLFDVPNEGGALMTQMTAQVFFVVSSAKDAVIAPLAALNPPGVKSAAANPEAKAEGGERRRGKGGQRLGDSAMVKVLRPDGSIEERAVKIGIKNRVSAQILEGLQPGEQVIAGIKQPQDVERASPGANQNRGPRI
jgi:membrane fusion protein, macrolide-specific efflux system